MKKLFLQISIIKLVVFTAIFFVIGLSSCNVYHCKNTSTYTSSTGGTRMLQRGQRPVKEFEMKPTKNPYYVKAKKPAKSHNYYSN